MTQGSKNPAGDGGASNFDLLCRLDRTEVTQSPIETQSGRYPHGPGYKDKAGRKTAEAIRAKVPGNRERVFAGVTEVPSTSEEVSDRIGMHWYRVRPRMTELHAMGRVIKTGEMGRGALGGTANRWRRATSEEFAIFNARKAVEAEKSGGGR